MMSSGGLGMANVMGASAAGSPYSGTRASYVALSAIITIALGLLSSAWGLSDVGGSVALSHESVGSSGNERKDGR